MESEVWNTARCTQYTLLKAIYILPEKWMFFKDIKLSTRLNNLNILITSPAT